MSIISLLKLLLSFASSLANYVHDKQLLDAGAAKAILEGVQNVQKQIDEASLARRDANILPVSKDPNNRDNG